MRNETEEKYIQTHLAPIQEMSYKTIFLMINFTKNCVGRCIANNTSYNLQSKTHQMLDSSTMQGVAPPLSIASVGREIEGTKTHS